MGKKRAASPIRSLVKAVVPPRFLRRVRGRNRRVWAQLKQGHHPSLGFLHIPKTGGSSLQALGRQLVRRGQPFPCCFPHGWSFADIREHYPDMRVALILRDPLERTISAFNSRLRQGRPAFSRPWKPAEAAAFAHFPDVRRYLDALIANDDWSISACAHARRHITHLRWNYRFYFRNPKEVRAQAEAIVLVGRIEATDGFIDALLAEAGIRPEAAEGLYERRHIATLRPSSVLAGYSAGDIARMRARLADEYAIHDALDALAKARAGTAPGAAANA